MENNSPSIVERPIIKSLFTLAIPIVLANLLQGAYQLIDAFRVGRLGGDAVASVSISFPIMFLLISMGTGFAVAGSTLIAQYFGAKKKAMVNHVAAQTLLMVLIVSLFLSVLGLVFSPMLLHLMGVEPAIFANALAFLRISFFGLLFVFGYSMFQSIMRGIGEVKMPMYIVLGTVVLNAILDPFFIYGFGPLPSMGVSGAAMATLFTQGIAAVIGISILFKGKYNIRVQWSDFIPDFGYIKKAFLLGLPSSLEMSSRGLGMVILTFLITSFGTQAVASYGAGSNILQLIIIPAMGLSMAVSILVGQNIGAKRMDRAAKTAKIGSLISFGLLTAIGIIVFFCASFLIKFFIPHDLAIVAGGTEFLRTVALTFGFMGLQMAILGVFRASGNMTTAFMLSVISQWVFQFPLAYILSKHTGLGIHGLRYTFPLTNIFTAIMCYFRFMRGTWKKTIITKEDKVIERISEETFVEEGTR
ncbi:MAG: MATE family efflux transporter [Candidatus Absconditabacterales bacterium]